MTPVLTHVALAVANLERTIAFYRKHVKLHVVHDRNDDGVRVVWLSERAEQPDFVLVLFEAGSAPGRGCLQHLGFAVASRDEVDAAAAVARADGVLGMAPIYAGPIVGYFCIVLDPDGNQIEFSHGQPIDPRQLPAA